MVEKIKRDVRITTIYEGTSEIMEMTIGRDRWQAHLKSRGAHYHDSASALETLHADAPGVGADIVALAHHGLAELMEIAREHRLTRNQHLLFRLGELVAHVECSAALARRAAATADGTLSAKTNQRLPDAGAVAAASRVFAREAARKVALDGVAEVLSAAEPGVIDLAGLQSDVGLAAVLAAQTGRADDMDTVSAAVYSTVG